MRITLRRKSENKARLIPVSDFGFAAWSVQVKRFARRLPVTKTLDARRTVLRRFWS